MRLHVLLERTTYEEALKVFAKYGVDARGLDPAQLKLAYRKLIGQHHPDRNPQGTAATQAINDAYDVLKTGRGGSGSAPHGSTAHARRPAQAPEHAEWAQAGWSGGARESSNIYRNDYTDVNFIKKSMWEKSGHSKTEWTIWGYDGAFFRGVVTVYGNAKIFPEMAKAMITWQTKGGNPYSCRAVFVQQRHLKELLLIYADGKFYPTPVRFEHDSFNQNPGNDQAFVRRLPKLLDDLRDNSRPDTAKQGEFALEH
jgi:hypothetical protein